jgi:tetratricopeptide (TPR) repeat protein
MSSCNKASSSREAESTYIAAVEAYSVENYVLALDNVNKVLEQDRNFHQALLLKGKILFFTDKLNDDELIFSNLTRKYPQYTESRIWYIRSLILSNKYSEAQTMIEEELSFNASDWRVFYLYSLLGQKTNNYELRLSMDRRAESILTDSAKVYMDLALAWYALGMNDRAYSYLEKANVVIGANNSIAQLENAIEQFMKGE